MSSKRIVEKKKRLIEAGYQAVDELTKVAKAKILKGFSDDDSDVAAEKMKNAAAAKKLAIDDAFSILKTIQEAEEELNEGSTDKVEKKKSVEKTDFRRVEQR